MATDCMQGYVGARFRAICLGRRLPSGMGRLVPDLREAGRRLQTGYLSFKNAGNLSARSTEGFVITTAGSCLASMTEDHLAWVVGVNPDVYTVSYYGANPPSSEAFLHAAVYAARPEARAIAHVHDPLANCGLEEGELPITAIVAPYGSAELAMRTVETLQASPLAPIVQMRQHGYVALGPDVLSALDHVLAMHDRLSGKARSQGRTFTDEELLALSGE